jgi:DNA-binding GntR family transcriptional regulator
LPGSRIPEEELAETYGIPRAKVREVLAVLEDRGLVERIPNKGAVVAHVDMETTYRLYEVREALDTLIVRLAMRNAKKEDWPGLAELLGPKFEESLRQGDIAAHVALIMEVRDRLKDIADNAILSDLIERIYDRTRVTMRRVALLPGRAEMGVNQYRGLFEAMQSGDMVAADRRVQELNESAREYIARYRNYVL